MSSYAYEAVDASGLRIQGSLDVASQSEALQRIKEMGLYPTRVSERQRPLFKPGSRAGSSGRLGDFSFVLPLIGGRVKPSVVAVFTRQLATLVEAGLPLLRGLRILQQQESNRTLKRILGELGETIEGGSSLSESLAAHPRVFNRLYVNMVKAGEIGGALEITLRRLAEFMEKAQRIKAKVQSAMFYPVAVMTVATAILGMMLVFVIPRFQQVFDGLLNGAAMPVFTTFILRISELVRHQAPLVALAAGALVVALSLGMRTKPGRWLFDQFKLTMPILGAVFRKAAISRFARTLGTLLANGVPVLQALTIVKETTGNVVVGDVVARVHESVKEGETLTAPLRTSRVFPPMVVGMVDVGEQTGALPDMLLKIADNFDDDVDNAVNSMTSLLEPILIVFLAVVVGSIVIAMFLPLLTIITGPGFGGPEEAD
ncbi:MAG: type II secretion system F family protein [Verrucomicrobia bacterium]|nr:type II secretion system F family protein [Verrucomicrobiota bacterium]